MKRKLLILMLSLMLVLSGCGKDAAEATGASASGIEEIAASGESAPDQEDENAGEKTAEVKKPEAEKPDQESQSAESTAASGEATQKDNSSKETSTEEQKAPDKTVAAATPEPTQKPEASKEQTNTDKATTPTATTSPAVTKAPSTPKPTQKPSSNQGSSSGTTSTPTPTPVPHTQCTWDGGSETTAASCASEGIKTYTCTVCGKTKTESIAKTSHNYVTETTEATCTTGGGSKTYCSNCGDVQSENTASGGLGHDYQKTFWNSSPSCSGAAYYMLICSRCGENGGDGIEPALGHSPVSEEICHGNCSSQTIVVTKCNVCDLELGRDAYFEDEHDWVTGTSDPIWDPETHSFVTHEVTYCSRCTRAQ